MVAIYDPEACRFDGVSVDFPNGKLVVELTYVDGRRRLRDVLSDGLRKYARSVEFDGLLIHLGDCDYTLTSHDLGVLLTTIAREDRKTLKPCSFVAHGGCGKHLNNIMEATRLIEFPAIHVSETTEEGRAHLTGFLNK